MDAPVGPSPSAPFAVPNNASRFTDIVARERARLGSFIRRQVRNAADAEDIDLMTRRVNGGMNGFMARLAAYRRARAYFASGGSDQRYADRPDFSNVRSGVDSTAPIAPHDEEKGP